ncbi:MAG: complex I NDUFA9 subunit family protein [Thermoanaerobaculaceae bacterium]|nr:complex I NDUFA9 subunit family protein [Thermoanaerobaculaceae bacterium]TAM46120.1 MAG: complex I NDUFA9 subunit family protein [Acidobacteriota bacterium]
MTEPIPSSARQAELPFSFPGRRVLLTGARGFVGREVRRQLLERGWEVVALSRNLRADDARPGVIQVAADIAGDGWQRWCEGCSAAIHLVGIIRERRRSGATFERAHVRATEGVIKACGGLGIRRFLHMSALGARAAATTPYHRTKWQAEEAVRGSGLDWTIFRPALIFGPGDGFTGALAPVLRRFPLVPVFGDGRYQLQPIAVAEVARCFVAALEDPSSSGRTYELGGPEALTYDEVLRRIASSLGLQRTLVHVPLGLAKLAISVVQHLPGAPITRDQLTMLIEGSTCDTAAARGAFGVPIAHFEGAPWLRPAARS